MANKDLSRTHPPENRTGEGSEPIQDMSFEQAMEELERISSQLDSNALSLADSLAAYQRGGLLLGHAKVLLESVQTQIEIVDEQGRRSVPSQTFLPDDGPSTMS